MRVDGRTDTRGDSKGVLSNRPPIRSMWKGKGQTQSVAQRVDTQKKTTLGSIEEAQPQELAPMSAENKQLNDNINITPRSNGDDIIEAAEKIKMMENQFSGTLQKLVGKNNEKFDLIFAILADLQSRQKNMEDTLHVMQTYRREAKRQQQQNINNGFRSYVGAGMNMHQMMTDDMMNAQNVGMSVPMSQGSVGGYMMGTASNATNGSLPNMGVMWANAPDFWEGMDDDHATNV